VSAVVLLFSIKKKGNFARESRKEGQKLFFNIILSIGNSFTLRKRERKSEKLQKKGRFSFMTFFDMLEQQN